VNNPSSLIIQEDIQYSISILSQLSSQLSHSDDKMGKGLAPQKYQPYYRSTTA
jgi:hypothetical protein